MSQILKVDARPAGRRKILGNPHGYSLWGGLLVAAAVLSTPGCASAPPPATQTVEVPVYVPCVVKRPERPVYEFDKLPADASDGRKVMALARDWLRARKYEGELEAVVAGCL